MVDGFAKRLRVAFAEKGVSQKDVAKALGISQPALSKYLAGKNLPTIDKAAQLAELLDVDLFYLITGRQQEGVVNNYHTEIKGHGNQLSGITIIGPGGKATQYRNDASGQTIRVLDKFIRLSKDVQDIIEKMIDIYLEKEGGND